MGRTNGAVGRIRAIEAVRAVEAIGTVREATHSTMLNSTDVFQIRQINLNTNIIRA